MTHRWTRILSVAIALLMLIGILPMKAIADAVKDEREDIFIPEIEIEEDILSHDVFYLTAPAAEIEENAKAIYLLRIGRGGNAESESTALIKISDMTAKYGEDYIVRVRGTEEEVVNPEDNMSLMEMMEGEEYEQMPLEDYEAAMEELANDPEAQAAYQEGVAEALEFLEEMSGLSDKYDGENPYAEAVEELYGEDAEKPAEEPAIKPDPNVVVTDGTEIETIGGTDEDGLDPVQRASNLFVGEDVVSQEVTTTQDMFEDLQKVANVLTDVVIGAYVEVTFAPGERSKYLEIIPINNDKSDGNRTFYLLLGAPQGTTTNSAASVCAFTIVDDEEPEECVLSFSEVEYVHTPGEESVVVTVERTGAMNAVVGGIVKTTGEGTAVMGRDYAEVDTTLIFPFGIPSLTVTIPVRTEPFTGEAWFGLSLEADAGCTIGVDHATVTMQGTYKPQTTNAFSTDPGSVSDTRSAGGTSIQTGNSDDTGPIPHSIGVIELGEKINIEQPYDSGHSDNKYGGTNKYNSEKKAWHLQWKDNSSLYHRKGHVGVVYKIADPDSRFTIAGARVTWARTGDCARVKVAFDPGSPDVSVPSGDWLTSWSGSSKDQIVEGGDQDFPQMIYDSNAAFSLQTKDMFPAEATVESVFAPQFIGIYNKGKCDNCGNLYIYEITPIKRPYQINLQKADPLRYLQEDGNRADDGGVATKSRLTGGADTQVIYVDEGFTVQDESDSNVLQFAYIRAIDWVDKDGNYIEELGTNDDPTNSSIAFMLTQEKTLELFGNHLGAFKDTITKNTSLENTLGCPNYSKLYVKPDFDYIDSTIKVRNTFDSALKITISTKEYVIPAKETVEIKADTIYAGYFSIDVNFHKGDTLALTSIEILDPAKAQDYKVVGANVFHKTSGAEADFEPDPKVFWNNEPIYISGDPNGHRLCYREVIIQPTIQKKENKITVRVKTSDLANFETSNKLTAGLLYQQGDTTVEAGYTYFTYANEDKTVAGKMYPITVTPKKGMVALWTDPNTARTYAQNTLYYKAGVLPDDNIIDLTAAPESGSITLTGTFRYMEYNLKNIGAGNESNRPATGAVITAGSAGGVANEDGYVSAGPVPSTGEANRYLRYLVSVNGTAMLEEIPMPTGSDSVTVDVSENFPNGVSPVTSNIFKNIDLTAVMSDSAYTVTDDKYIPIVSDFGTHAIVTVKIRPRAYAVSMTVPFGVLETRKTETPLAVQFVVYDSNDVYKGSYDLVDTGTYEDGSWVFRSNIDFEIAPPIEIDPDAPEPDPDDPEPEPEPEGGFEVNAGDKLYLRLITNRMSAADALLTDLQEAVELLPEPERVTSNEATVTVPMGAKSFETQATRDAEEGEPELTVEMTADPEAGYALGDTILFTVTVTNTGAVQLGNIKLNHTLAGLEMIDGDDLTLLEPGDSATVKYLYDVTQADVNKGKIENTVTAIGDIDPVIANFADVYQYSDVFTGMSFVYPYAVKVQPKQTVTTPVTVSYPELPLVGNTGLALPFPFVTVGCMRISQGYRLYVGISPVQIYDSVKKTHISSFHADDPDGTYWKDTFSMKNPFGTFWQGLKNAWNIVGSHHAYAKALKQAKQNFTKGVAGFGAPQWRFDFQFGAFFNYHYYTVYANGIESTHLKFSGGGIWFSFNLGFKMAWYTILPLVFIPAYLGIEVNAYLMAFLGLAHDMENSVSLDEASQKQVDYASDARFEGDVRIVGYFQLSIGIGLCDIIGIRLAGRVNAIGAWNPGEKHGQFGLYLSVSAGIIVDLFLFSVPIIVEIVGWPFGFFEFYYNGGEDVAGNVQQTRKMSTNGYVLRQGSGEDSRWRGGQVESRYAFAPGSTQILADNSYERADSQLITLDDGTVVLAFIDSDNAKGPYQRTTLKLATYKNGVWSNPVPVSVDDTADFQPSIAETKDGRVLVAWVSTGSADIDENTPVVDYLNSMEVYAAFATINGDGSVTMDEPVKITNDHRIKDGVEKGYYDCMPTVVCDKVSGDAIVYCVKSGNTTTDGNELSNPYVNDCRVFYMIYNAEEDVDTDGRVVPAGWLFNNFYYGEFHGNTASEQYMIENFGGQRSLIGPTYEDENGSLVAYAIPDFTAIGYNGLAVFAYTVDTDNSNDTYDDKELYLQVYNFEQHEMKYRIRITDDNVADTLPQFFRSKDAEFSTEEAATHTKLFWYRDNSGVVYIDVTQLLQQGINPDGSLIVSDEDETSRYVDPIPTGLTPDDSNAARQSASYRVVEDANGSLFILWTDTVVLDDPNDEDAEVAQEIFATSLISSGKVMTDEDAELPENQTESTGWSKPYRLTRDGYMNDEIAVTMQDENLIVVHNRFRQELVIPETDTPAEDGINYDGEVDFNPLEITDMKLVATVMEPCGAIEPESIEVRYPGENGEAASAIVENPNGGEEVLVTVGVSNNGLTSAIGYMLTLYAVDKNGNETQIGTVESTEAMRPNISRGHSFTYTLPENVEGLTFKAVAKELKDEGVYFGNSAEFVSEPLYRDSDYRFDKLETYQDNDGFHASFEITNVGNAPSDEGDMLTVEWKGPEDLTIGLSNDECELVRVPFETPIEPGETREIDMLVPITVEMMQRYGISDVSFSVTRDYIETVGDNEYTGREYIGSIEYDCFVLAQPMNMTLEDVTVREGETAEIGFSMDLGSKFSDAADMVYTVEDLEIAQISDGKVLGVSEGTTTLYATHTATGATVAATITVEEATPVKVTFVGEDIVANDEYEIVDGEILYRYDVTVSDLPENGCGATGAQIFLAYDPDVLALRRTEGAFDWTVNDQNGRISAVWASETERIVENGEELLTLYFAKIGDAEKTDITFTENTLGNGSTMAFVIKDQIVELNAGTTDGSITFEAILYGDANVDGKITAADAAMVLRSIVGLSAITKRGALNAEVDGDGSVTAADAAAILRYVVGLINIFPAQQP